MSPRSSLHEFLSRRKFSTLTTRQPMVEFYLTQFSRFPLQKKQETIQIIVFTTIELTTSALVGVYGYLLHHSGDDVIPRFPGMALAPSAKGEPVAGYLAESGAGSGHHSEGGEDACGARGPARSAGLAPDSREE